MRQGGKNRSRGRNGRNGHKPHIPMRIQTFDSAGPDVRIRGNAWQVHERYLNLAREAFQAGDRVAAENFFQYADHYYRMVNGEGRPQQGPNGQPPHQQGQPIPQQGQHPQGPNQQPPIPGQHPQMGQPQMQQGQPLPQGQIHQGQPMGYPPHPQTGGQDQREAEQAEPLDRGRLPHPGE